MSQLLQFYKSFQQNRAPVTKSAPTFEDLTIDDKLSEQQRVVRYVKSTIGLQRLVHVKMMADVAASVGFKEAVETIIPLIEPLSKDVESVVKQHLAEQLRYLAKFCRDAGGEEGYRVVLEQILPITAYLLEDEKSEVRQSASMTLVEVAQLIEIDDIGQYVLTIILRLAHEDDKEEMRMTASQLLNLLAVCLGQDLCKQFVIPEVVSLAEDPVFRVRKSTALNFHSICMVGGEHELLERLMPAFVRLSKDDMYRVRRACAESLSEISKNVSEDVRLGVLVEIFLRLTHDPSKLVKQSILQQSGVFIATLPSKAVNETILNQYCCMISSPTGDVSVDNELRHICAYSFPAVFQVIGPSRWHEVRDVYHTLAQSRSANIKQTLAYSLHEVARILGDKQLVEEELIPVFEDMIQDVEVVQIGIIKYLAKFLSMLPGLCRVSYLPLLHDILHSTNPFNWRLRQHLARQLPDLVELPPAPDLYRTLFPTVMILLQDPVAGVRRETFKGVTALINTLYSLAYETHEEEGHCNNNNNANDNSNSADRSNVTIYRQNVADVVRAVNSFAVGEKYQLRQLWLEFCSQLLRDLPRSFFEDNFIDGILTLTCDPVTNVRVALSYFLVDWAGEIRGSAGSSVSSVGVINALPPWEDDYSVNNEETAKLSSSALEAVATGSTVTANPTEDVPPNSPRATPWHWLLRRTDIKACVERLSKDDNDVFLNLSKLQPLYPDIVFQSVSCRGRKTPPGGITPVQLDFTPITLTEPLVNKTAALAIPINASGGENHSSSIGTQSANSTLDVNGIDVDVGDNNSCQDLDSMSPQDPRGDSTIQQDSVSSIASSEALTIEAASEADGGSTAGDTSFDVPDGAGSDNEEGSAGPVSKSRSGSITVSEIHLDNAVDISPVEINLGSMSNLSKSPATSFHVPVAPPPDLDHTNPNAVRPTAIMADELDLLDEGDPSGSGGVRPGSPPVNIQRERRLSLGQLSHADEDDDDDEDEGDVVPYAQALEAAEAAEAEAAAARAAEKAAASAASVANGSTDSAHPNSS